MPANQFSPLVSCVNQRIFCLEMSARVLYLSCPWLRFLLNLRFAEIHFAIQRGFFCINRGANEHLSSNLAFHQGGQAETVGMSQKASKSCRQSAAAPLVLRRIRTVDISGMSESNDSNPDWVWIPWLDVLRCARSVKPPRTEVERAKRRTHFSKVNAFCAQASESGTRDRERETDSGKSDSFFQCPNVVLFVLKLTIVAIRFVVLVGSARASSSAKIIRVPLCAAHVAWVVEKMSVERKVVGSAAMDGAKRHVGGQRKSTFPN